MPSTLSLSAVNGGVIAFDDGINGRYYHINISGDVCAACDEARIIFNHEVNNVIDFTLNSTQMGLGHKAVIRTSGNYTALNAPISDLIWICLLIASAGLLSAAMLSEKQN